MFAHHALLIALPAVVPATIAIVVLLTLNVRGHRRKSGERRRATLTRIR